ncbi:MAG: hypothetical protein M3303_05635 [Gemmatimonadota bacterium]|nr:hypothetical protein [Gemmatimonadota bacterium]
MRKPSRTTPRSRSRTVIVAATRLLALGAAPSCLTAQTYWRIPGALGGALVGAGAGWVVDVARALDEGVIGPDLIMTPVGIGVGGVLGFIGGLRADRRLARGDSLGRGARVTLRVATFLAPVAAGSAIAFSIINPRDEGSCVPSPDPNGGCTFAPPPSKIASDGTVALVAIGGGAFIGFVAQHKFARALWPKARLGLAPGGRGVMVSIAAGW